MTEYGFSVVRTLVQVGAGGHVIEASIPKNRAYRLSVSTFTAEAFDAYQQTQR
jgi:hypothetical protein